jgi:hypothetical protein
METGHYRWSLCCVSTFHVDGNNTEAQTTIIFFKKLYFGDSKLWLYYFYGSVWINPQFYAFQQLLNSTILNLR